jgi:hypothetical protein
MTSPHPKGYQTFDPPDVPYCVIPLNRGLVCYVSPHRFEELKRSKWTAAWSPSSSNYYAIRVPSTKEIPYYPVSMQRFIMGLDYKDKRTVDHIRAGDTLNNTDENLRIASHAEQQRNRRKRTQGKSLYKGVTKGNKDKWLANIRKDKENFYLGTFNTEEEAYAAYCAASIELHGEFSNISTSIKPIDNNPIKAQNNTMPIKKSKPSLLCRRGHRKTGKNRIIRKRGEKKIIECRTCANASLQARREARKRNAKLLKGEE